MALLPKMMLGFIVRRCTVALGHAPTAAEFARWANNQPNGADAHCLFGRPITETEAAAILRHPARPVSARSATPHEQLNDDGAESTGGNVIRLDLVVKRGSSRPPKKSSLRSR
jgi:hypothetical protein